MKKKDIRLSVPLYLLGIPIGVVYGLIFFNLNQMKLCLDHGLFEQRVFADATFLGLLYGGFFGVVCSFTSFLVFIGQTSILRRDFYFVILFPGLVTMPFAWWEPTVGIFTYVIFLAVCLIVRLKADD
jgi:hypothetical protein